jgi:hypothetical protein
VAMNLAPHVRGNKCPSAWTHRAFYVTSTHDEQYEKRPLQQACSIQVSDTGLVTLDATANKERADGDEQSEP